MILYVAPGRAEPLNLFSHALLPEGSLSLDLSGRTRYFTHIRFTRSPGDPIQEPSEQSGFLNLFQGKRFFQDGINFMIPFVFLFLAFRFQ